MFGPKTWCTKKPKKSSRTPLGYLLTSCPGQDMVNEIDYYLRQDNVKTKNILNFNVTSVLKVYKQHAHKYKISTTRHLKATYRNKKIYCLHTNVKTMKIKGLQ